jgi:hypothetical protein
MKAVSLTANVREDKVIEADVAAEQMVHVQLVSVHRAEENLK